MHRGGGCDRLHGFGGSRSLTSGANPPSPESHYTTVSCNAAPLTKTCVWNAMLLRQRDCFHDASSPENEASHTGTAPPRYASSSLHFFHRAPHPLSSFPLFSLSLFLLCLTTPPRAMTTVAAFDPTIHTSTPTFTRSARLVCTLQFVCVSSLLPLDLHESARGLFFIERRTEGVAQE